MKTSGIALSITLLAAVMAPGFTEAAIRVAVPPAVSKSEASVLSDALRGLIPERGVASTVPATRWNDGFPTGNGRIGTLVYGQPVHETIVFNHARLYLPLPHSPLPDLGKTFPEVRRIMREKGGAAARAFSMNEAEKQGHSYYQSDVFHMAFEMKLDMKGTGAATDYLRTTDFRSGEVAVRFRDGAGDCVRKTFVSQPADAVVMSIARPDGKKVGLTLRPTPIVHKFVKSDLQIEKGWITYSNAYKAGGGGYDNAVRIVTKGGTVTCDGKTVTVDGADEVLLISSVAWHAKLEAGSVEALKSRLAVLPADYETLLKPHAEIWAEKMDRVKLDLGGAPENKLTTEELLAKAKAGKFRNNPRALIEKMYDAGRFYFLCSSGEVPPNLQGLWNGQFEAPWGGSYTYDTNFEIAMDSALSANMAEGMEPFFRMIESLLADWRTNAKKLFGCRGVAGQIVGSPNSGLSLAFGAKTWAWQFWTPGAGWMASYFYDYYRFTGDKVFLEKRAVPFMKEIALFYEDYLCETDANGRFVFAPSSSPEVGGLTLSVNSTLDVAVAKELFTNLIASCETLGIEKENVAKWRAMLAKMPAYQVGPKGDLCEWADGKFTHAYNHRHHSPFYPLFRSFEFTPESTPDLWKAAGTALSFKTAKWLRKTGVDYQGIPFGRSFHGQCAAYLGRGDVVEEVLNLMADRVYSSLFMSISPDGQVFGFDGLGTYPDLINRSLVFSLDGTLDLLRSVPPGWETGSISGILARGQLKINRLQWNQTAGTATLELTSGIAQTLTLRLPCHAAIREVKVLGGDATVAPAIPANVRTLTLPANRKVTLEIRFSPERIPFGAIQ